MTCARCRKETDAFTMSMFNTQEICLDCKDKEKKHPKYQEASDAEMRAVRSGNYNYRGIGKPLALVRPPLPSSSLLFPP